ncbi:hypothetical protein ILYODFUR_000436 [Ilyodon furcidens]|uniref:Uncharacterized protein n=1 Tax=Ilyodon furcidens TaxID=33524 RepID=A0ABV0TQP1_9TELE
MEKIRAVSFPVKAHLLWYELFKNTVCQVEAEEGEEVGISAPSVISAQEPPLQEKPPRCPIAHGSSPSTCQTHFCDAKSLYSVFLLFGTNTFSTVFYQGQT